MKQVTIRLPDESFDRLRRESQTRGSSMASIVREAVDRHLAEVHSPGKRRLGFIGIAKGHSPDDSERVDELLGEAMARRADRLFGS